jgi:hypothetical protein
MLWIPNQLHIFMLLQLRHELQYILRVTAGCMYPCHYFPMVFGIGIRFFIVHLPVPVNHVFWHVRSTGRHLG